MELKWEKPEKDGGRPITHYVIECKNKFLTDWTECAKTENDDCVGKVHGLKEKVVYQFRVRAVNKGGASKASEPSDNHTVKHKNRKCCKIGRQTQRACVYLCFPYIPYLSCTLLMLISLNEMYYDKLSKSRDVFETIACDSVLKFCSPGYVRGLSNDAKHV